MKLRTIPPATLTGVTTLLQPYANGLSSETLVAALRAYDAGDRPATVPAGQLLTLREAADRLSCSRHSLWRMIRAGQLPAVTIGARARRVPEAAVVALAKGGDRHA